VAKIVSLDRFATPEKLVGYFGIFPEEESSGVDAEGRPLPSTTRHMSHKGCDLVRGYLWNAAKAAIQQNPAVRELYARLVSRGTRGDVALGHCMRKLLHQVFGVWASQRPFDEYRARTGHARKIRSVPESAEPALEKPAAATPPTEAVTECPETETAAGHNREPVPDRSVVTAAASRLEPVSSSSVSRPETTGTIDYGALREQIGLEQILSRIGVLPQLRGATQRRGRCPLCQTDNSFSVNLHKNAYQCFHPGCSRGNVLDFWAAYQRLPLHQAAQHLAETFGLQIQPPKPTRTTPKAGRHHARRR
jgi:hypothetical protein